MKIRTDFVTNSSSSSFIFEKGTDFEKIKKEAGELLQQLMKEDKWLDDLESRYELQFLDSLSFPDRISKLGLWGQQEIFDWYEYEKMKQVLDKEPQDVKQWSEEAKNTYFCNIILENCYTYCYELNVEEDGTSHYDKLMEKLVELYHEIPWYCCDEIYESDKYLKQKEDFVLEYHEELINYCMKLQKEGVKTGELLERFFDCEYVLYDDMESPRLMSEVLEKIKECLWSCNHMG